MQAWPKQTKYKLRSTDETIDHLFFAGFFEDDGELGALEGCSGCSAILATVMIWICWLTGAVGRAASSSCSSPSPTDCRRLDEILKVLTRTSRIASARRWLRMHVALALAVRLDMADDQERVGQHGRLDQRVGDAPAASGRIRVATIGVSVSNWMSTLKVGSLASSGAIGGRFGGGGSFFDRDFDRSITCWRNAATSSSALRRNG